MVSGFVDTANKMSLVTGAGDTDSILAIVPVQVKAKNGNKVVTSYAFLDPGSTATFCTEELMSELSLRGKKINSLLTTMGDQKTVKTNLITDLEVSSLEGCNFIALREVFSQTTIPANKGNIPLQKDVKRWPHLQGVRIPHIDAEIGLLIGTNVPRAMEPEEVIKSADDGPYTVKTVLGWTVNGPLKEGSCEPTTDRVAYDTSNRISVAKLDEL